VSARTYGVIVRTDAERGMILVLDGRSLMFSRDQYGSKTQREPVRGLPVKLEIVEHLGVAICRAVVPLEEEEDPVSAEGVVLRESGTEFADGAIQLSTNIAGIAAYRKTVLTGPLLDGRYVNCIVVPRRAGEWFALRVDPQRSPPRNIPPPLKAAAATRKSCHYAKSVNEDAFLVTTLAGGEFWLAAVADGISGTKESWWASNLCMELLWQSRESFEKDLLEDFDRQAKTVVARWIDWIHAEFIIRRSKNDSYREANAAFTMAVGRRRSRRYVVATCGDCRVYQWPSETSQQQRSQAEKIITDEDLKSQRVSTTGLKNQLMNHIGADKHTWEERRLVLEARPLPAGGRVVLCTDGVITQRNDQITFGAKFTELNTVFRARSEEEMQHCVDAALDRIRALGEQDDMTVVLVWP
jgi:serine/threonine protein phosphatase PrpC